MSMPGSRLMAAGQGVGSPQPQRRCLASVTQSGVWVQVPAGSCTGRAAGTVQSLCALQPAARVCSSLEEAPGSRVLAGGLTALGPDGQVRAWRVQRSANTLLSKPL